MSDIHDSEEERENRALAKIRQLVLPWKLARKSGIDLRLTTYKLSYFGFVLGYREPERTSMTMHFNHCGESVGSLELTLEQWKEFIHRAQDLIETHESRK